MSGRLSKVGKRQNSAQDSTLQWPRIGQIQQNIR